ncbi:MAG: DUF3280 domain-containing protein [Burkholderiaceae bacterium]
MKPSIQRIIDRVTIFVAIDAVSLKSVLRVKALQCIGVILLSCVAWSSAKANETKTIVLLPFELIDSAAELVPFPDKDERLRMVSSQLHEQFVEKQLYRVLSSPEIDAAIKLQQSRYNLSDCNGCEQDIAKVAGSDRVLIAWVQRATALILNVNIDIRDTQTGETVLRKSSEIRGNTDANWRRAVRHIVRSMVDRDQANR